MQTITWTSKKIDKEAWGEGPWTGEPDKIQWADPHTGLPCLAVRSIHAGSWCGYVGVSRRHPLHGYSYDFPANVQAHGGLTFSGACQPDNGDPEHPRICHVPAPGEPDDIWWFGFDCAHYMDFLPAMHAYMVQCGHRSALIERDEEYRDLVYVRHQCELLAAQLDSYGWTAFYAEHVAGWLVWLKMKFSLARRRFYMWRRSNG